MSKQITISQEEYDQLIAENKKQKAFIAKLEPVFKDLLFASADVTEVIEPLVKALQGGKNMMKMITKASNLLLKLPEGRIDQMTEQMETHIIPICKQFVPYYQKQQENGNNAQS
ncbi:MAG: hypothetical protein AAF206_27810 [Bacteroidota bacterium]